MSLNAFQVMQMEPRPVLNRDRLKEKLHEISRQLASEGEGGGEVLQHSLNESYRILSSDVSRIHHLLKLSGCSNLSESSPIPGKVLDLFNQVGPVLHRADDLIKRMDEAASTLEKAMLQEEVLTMATELQKVAGTVGDFRRSLFRELEALDAVWLEVPDWKELKMLYGDLVYVERWAGQLDEKIFRVMNF